MAVVYSEVYTRPFPATPGPGTPENFAAHVIWNGFATSIEVHLPFITGYTNYWVEWCANADFTGTIHVTEPVVPQAGFDESGDVFVGNIVGFEPSSLWHFRAGASSAGELPPNAPEQSMEP